LIFNITENENLNINMLVLSGRNHFVTSGFLKVGNHKCNTLSNIILWIQHQMAPVMNST